MRNTFAIIVFFLILILVAFFIHEQYKHPSAIPQSIKTVKPSEAPVSLPAIGARTKDSGCVAHDAVPDKECTPGAIFPDVTAKDICVPGYSKRVRDVSTSLKKKVFAEYGITHHAKGEYEVDHLVSLELGGSNDIANLFPEAAEPRPGFHEKDKVENYLHREVCAGRMDLREAQSKIANDWLSVYRGMGN